MNDRLPEPVTGPSAWTSAELAAADDWICLLGDTEIKEIESAIEGLALEAVGAVCDLASRDDLRYDLAFRMGDIQILNNHMILHARGGFEDFPEPERKRDLLRLWINLRNGRKLAPEFADRLNTGPRGGVMVRHQEEERSSP